MRAIAALLCALILQGCGEADLTEAEKATVASLSLSSLGPLPPDPSNRFADAPLAAAFGATLFFDQRLSRDGNVSCSTCHLVDRQFQDDRALSVGLGTTDRRSMPLAGVARSPFLFWDGRRDSLWAQALTPLEDAREHGGNRTAYVRFVAQAYGQRYENIFGPLPDLDGLPENAGPLGTTGERAAWAAMPEARRNAIDAAFANIGKAIAAFERSIIHEPTRFDRFADALKQGRSPGGDEALSGEELYGLRLFIGRAECVNCHNGPRFTDDQFHNTGVPNAPGLPPDLGRTAAVDKVLADPFNCIGAYSDAPEDGCRELAFMNRDGPELVRAFKTPSLRGAATRPPYMHAGQIATLDKVIDHYKAAPKSPDGESQVIPLKLSDREKAALIEFLKTLAE